MFVQQEEESGSVQADSRIWKAVQCPIDTHVPLVEIVVKNEIKILFLLFMSTGKIKWGRVYKVNDSRNSLLSTIVIVIISGSSGFHIDNRTPWIRNYFSKVKCNTVWRGCDLGIRSTNWENVEVTEALGVENMLEKNDCGNKGGNVRNQDFSHHCPPAALDIIP